MKDWCKFFADIEKDPKAIVPTITVREYLQAREHLHSCDVCYNRSERVLKDDPRDVSDNFSKN